MSRLTAYPEDAPGAAMSETESPSEIAAALRAHGIRFERWEASAPLAPGAGQPEVFAAYASEMAMLQAEGGYVQADVVRMKPDHPDRVAIRQKFLAEHTHSDDEVRFFVEGAGLFCFHVDGKVMQLLATAGDLVSVPAGIKHWFDTGPAPSFAAIRLFADPAGWVAQYTGDPIARAFPTYEP